MELDMAEMIAMADLSGVGLFTTPPVDRIFDEKRCSAMRLAWAEEQKKLPRDPVGLWYQCGKHPG
ncbi:hypothetical protein [Nonomuraea rubra]|uniref:hypothetical protein n=1 Tax=Nonomuraea rubra TaxID=46180 RepID=UPI0033D95F02